MNNKNQSCCRRTCFSIENRLWFLAWLIDFDSFPRDKSYNSRQNMTFEKKKKGPARSSRCWHRLVLLFLLLHTFPLKKKKVFLSISPSVDLKHGSAKNVCSFEGRRLQSPWIHMDLQAIPTETLTISHKSLVQQSKSSCLCMYIYLFFKRDLIIKGPKTSQRLWIHPSISTETLVTFDKPK